MESGSRKKIRPKLCQMPKLGRLRYTFCLLFSLYLPFWIRIRFPILILFGYWSTTLPNTDPDPDAIAFGSCTDPDPKHWKKLTIFQQTIKCGSGAILLRLFFPVFRNWIDPCFLTTGSGSVSGTYSNSTVLTKIDTKLESIFSKLLRSK